MRKDWVTEANQRRHERKADREAWQRRQQEFAEGKRYQDENTNDVRGYDREPYDPEMDGPFPNIDWEAQDRSYIESCRAALREAERPCGRCGATVAYGGTDSRGDWYICADGHLWISGDKGLQPAPADAYPPGKAGLAETERKGHEAIAKWADRQKVAWILTSPVTGEDRETGRGAYVTDGKREAWLSVSPDGELRFDGEFVDVGDDYPEYLAVIDEIAEFGRSEPDGRGDRYAQFEYDSDSDYGPWG